jgi:hypothetical protein
VGTRATGEARYGTGADEVHRTFLRVLESLPGFHIQSSDPATGRVNAARGMNLATWGENVDVTVRALGPGDTAVTVTSRLKFGLFDWGRNRRNVDQILGSAGAVLPQPMPPPPG